MVILDRPDSVLQNSANLILRIEEVEKILKKSPRVYVRPAKLKLDEVDCLSPQQFLSTLERLELVSFHVQLEEIDMFDFSLCAELVKGRQFDLFSMVEIDTKMVKPPEIDRCQS